MWRSRCRCWNASCPVPESWRGKSAPGTGKPEGQFPGGILSLVNKRDIESERRIDDVIGCGGADQTGVLRAKRGVEFRLLDGHDQGGDESGIGAGSGGGGSGGSGAPTVVDRDRGGVVWTGRVDCDGNGGGGRRRAEGPGRDDGSGCGRGDRFRRAWHRGMEHPISDRLVGARDRGRRPARAVVLA